MLQLLAGAGMLGLCLAAQRAGWPRRRLTLSALLLASCWMTVFNPAAEACTYMLLAPALGWGLIQGFRRPWPAAARWLCVASGLLLLVCTIAVWFPTGKTLHVWGLQPAAGLLLLAALVRAQISELAAPVNAPASA